MLPSPCVPTRPSLDNPQDDGVGEQMLEASLDLVRLADVMLGQDHCTEAESLWNSAIERYDAC